MSNCSYAHFTKKSPAEAEDVVVSAPDDRYLQMNCFKCFRYSQKIGRILRS